MQSSLAGGVGGGIVAVTVASHPADIVAQSLLNSTKSELPVEVTELGIVVPVYVPTKGASMLSPSYMKR